jgi:hypothetical protein
MEAERRAQRWMLLSWCGVFQAVLVGSTEEVKGDSRVLGCFVLLTDAQRCLPPPQSHVGSSLSDLSDAHGADSDENASEGCHHWPLAAQEEIRRTHGPLPSDFEANL